jgi:CBS domain containing-hemolysin-like protein
LLLLFAVLFSPVAVLLGMLALVLQKVMGETPLRVRLTLALRELQQILKEGQEAGILKPAQRRVAQGLFGTATAPIARYMSPVNRTVSVRLGCSRQSALSLARRHNAPLMAVKSRDGKEYLGYLQVVDLRLSDEEEVNDYRPVLRVGRSESFVSVLLRLQQEKEELAVVTDASGKTVGLLHARDLAQHLFREAR